MRGTRSHATAWSGRHAIGRGLQTTVSARARMLPLLVLVPLALAAVGFGLDRWLGRVFEEKAAATLEAVHRTQVAAIELGATDTTRQSNGIARATRVRDAGRAILEAPTDEARLAEAATMRAELETVFVATRYTGFLVVDARGRGAGFVGGPCIVDFDLLERAAFRRAVRGEARLSAPFVPIGTGTSSGPGCNDGRPAMWTFSPLRDEGGDVIGVLALRVDPGSEFFRVLATGRGGRTLETYAIDVNGRMVSESRFTNELVRVGLVPKDEARRTTFGMPVRDPGVDLLAGRRPKTPRDEWPATRMARSLLQRKTGHSLEGYRDYRGVDVIGTGTWLHALNVGVVTEMDRREAYDVWFVARWVGRGILFLTVTFAAAAIGSTMRARQLAGRVDRAVALGQYQLERKLGSGGMGTVYLAKHALLARPTAVKLIALSGGDPDRVKRFEREVRLTARLTHPNTIAVYDCGTTDDGFFYYAMEYLDGVDLETLVAASGKQPAARVIHILRQILGSLEEAHELGMVHRDVKPSNVMLTRRGTIDDFAKVLDFGLVRERGDADEKLTGARQILGTPLYMAPETLVDAATASPRSDLYATGCVAYFLLTGRDAFAAGQTLEVVARHLSGDVDPPSKLVPGIPEELETLVLELLALDAAKRPESAAIVEERLAAMAVVHPWSRAEAKAAYSADLVRAKRRTEASLGHAATISATLSSAGSRS